MTSKKNTKTSTSSNLLALKIGSRVRCTDDGVTGRIVWANGVSVKITWDDDEQVTWKRDSLADRPIEILDTDESTTADPQAEPQVIPTTADEAAAPEETTVPAVAVPIPEIIAEQSLPERTPDEALSESVPALPTSEASAAAEPAPSETVTVDTTAAEQPPTAIERKARRTVKKSETTSSSDKKLSALDAAAKVLVEAGTAMTCQEMIEAMAAKGYWTSPGGKTPGATLYSAIAREITTKGADSRFAKADRGKFTRNAGA